MHWGKCSIAALSVALVLCSLSAIAAKKTIPTYFAEDIEFKDVFVQRSGPDTNYKSGYLGVILTSYGREPLFFAYRALTLGPEKLAQQAAATTRPSYDYDPPSGGIKTWLEARSTATDKALPREPKQDRSFEGRAYGGYLNCPNGAFNLAAETLQSLQHDQNVSKEDIQTWVSAQDAVFDLCGDGDPTASARQIPPQLGKGAPLYLRQLRQYQIAAANFYAGNYDEAVRLFDAIASEKNHPMRAWSAHAAMRALLRSASLDQTFLQRVMAIRNSTDPMTAKREAFVAAQAENNRKMARIYGQIATRQKAILADKTLATIHTPARKLLKQAALMIAPDQVYLELSAALGRFDKDVEISGESFQWGLLGDRLFDYGGNADLIAQLRAKYDYFDWIRTIQACTDNALSPNYSGHCAEENAHALKKWRANKNKTWLVATLMTARQLTPQLDPAIKSARQVAPTSMEYLTVHYYLARLLREAGRRDEAIALIDPILSNGTNSKSADNLFKQERLALARNDDETLPYLLRESRQRLGADGDELLNRQLSTADMLRLAKNPLVDNDLRNQLLVAAWWRSDMLGDARSAENAAHLLADAMPTLQETMSNYLTLTNADDRHYELAKAALKFSLSPQVFATDKNFGGRGTRGNAGWWCSFGSFNSDDFKERARIQRIPLVRPELAADTLARDIEMDNLRKIGNPADWLARVVIQRAKGQAADPNLRPLLTSLIKSESLDCNGIEDDNLIRESREIVASLPGNEAQPIPEAALREEYDRVVSRLAGKKEYRIYHILVRSEPVANTILAEIKNGANFEDIARQQSIDTASGIKGGDLGWALPEIYVKPFADAARSMTAPGLYPVVVRSPFGWHIIRVTDIRPISIPSYERARPYIEKSLRKRQEN